MPDRLKRIKDPTRLPDFKNDEEIADFFDSHDTSELLKTLPEAGPIIDARRPLKAISLRLPPETIEAAKRVARDKGIAYQAILRLWIMERLAVETAGKKWR